MKAGWKTKRLEEICSIELGSTPPRGSPRYWDPEKMSGNVWLSIADLLRGTGAVVDDSKEYLSNEGRARGKIVKAGTLLLSFKLTIGRLAFAGCDLQTNEAIAALEIKDSAEISKAYLYWFLMFFDWEKASEGEDKIKGKTLNKAKLRLLEVLIPPLDEQRRIVAVLDKAFAGIDTATDNAQKNLTNARALFESYTSEAFEHLNETATVRPSLEALTDEKSGITYGVVKPGDAGNIPFVRGGDLIGGEVRLHKLRTITSAVSEQYNRTLLRGGELLMCLVGVPGQCAIAPNELAGANIARQVGLIRLKPEVNAEYVKDYLQSPVGQTALGTFTGGSVQQVINLGDLRQVEVPLPERSRQDEMVKRIAVAKSLSGDLARKFDRKLAALSELKQSLLQRAFAGELT